MQGDMGKNMTLHLQAPAKINFVLKVLCQRSDGYHELETWMQKLDLCDEVTLELNKGGGIELYCDDPTLPVGAKNLAYRAAETFLKATENIQDFGVTVRLKKRIPVAAGLGGGSSDAGTVLKGLNKLFGEEVSQDELQVMGKALGADVPFFVTGYGAVLATGIGEKIIPVPAVDDVTFLLVNLGIAVSTQWAFEKYALTREDKNSRMRGSHKLKSDSLELSDMDNDLEQVTINRYPEIEEVKDNLRSAGAQEVLMSGSGPTVFGVFSDTQKNQKNNIDEAAIKMRLAYGSKVFIARAYTGV